MKVFAIRHGETEWSLNGRHTGTTDIPLTENGRKLAEKLRPVLANEGFSLVLVSPLQRAQETCRLAGLDKHPVVDPDLAEWNYGKYEGLTPDDIHKSDPDWMIFRDGCPGGETPEQVGARVDRVIAQAREAHGDVALFAHGHVLRVLAARWIGLPAQAGQHFLLGTGTLCVLGYYRDVPAIRIWNGATDIGARGRAAPTQRNVAMKTGTSLRGAIFDVDGVLVASPHERAWREALAAYTDPRRFTTQFYQTYVAGKPRLDGARITLKRLDVPNHFELAPEYAERKQAIIDRLIEEGRFEAFPDAVRFAAALRAAGLKLALASSSKNADAMLKRLTLPDGRTLLSIFSADLSGCEVRKGKPEPELFLLAAGALSFSPSECVIVEDAPAGIRAAKDGGMASVGIARLGDDDLLRDAGADLVVNRLDQVDVAALTSGVLRAAPVHPA